MNLGFKDRFKDLILSGSKIHTIRKDEADRWGIGTTIHFCTGLRTKQYNQFKVGECISTQKIQFKWENHNIGLVSESWSVQVFIDGFNVTNETDIIDQLVKNDGFNDRKEFFEWDSWNKKNFEGKIIHFTNKRYKV